MSRNAARAMRDLAECMREVAEEESVASVKATMRAMARAHDKAAGRIEAWPADEPGRLGATKPR